MEQGRNEESKGKKIDEGRKWEEKKREGRRSINERKKQREKDGRK